MASENPLDYENNGLPIPLEQLERDRNLLSSMTTEEQARYADGVCVANANSTEFHNRQLKHVRDRGPNYPVWNTCSVGNTAYMALHAPPEYREEYKQLLQGYFDWKNSQCVIS